MVQTDVTMSAKKFSGAWKGVRPAMPKKSDNFLLLKSSQNILIRSKNQLLANFWNVLAGKNWKLLPAAQSVHIYCSRYRECSTYPANSRAFTSLNNNFVVCVCPSVSLFGFQWRTVWDFRLNLFACGSYGSGRCHYFSKKILRCSERGHAHRMGNSTYESWVPDYYFIQIQVKFNYITIMFIDKLCLDKLVL